MADLPIKPLGTHVLLRLDADESYESATVVDIGGGVPESYGIERYSRVLFDQSAIIREYSDDKSKKDILEYEPDLDDEDDDEYDIPKYLIIDATSICAMVVKNKR